MVGAKGFEPSTLWSQTRCATRLRYAPTARILTAKGSAKVSPMTLIASTLPWLEAGQDFPPSAQAWRADSQAPGLLAAGGRLDTTTLEKAYSQGIFPWFSEGQPVLWWSPDPRMVLDVFEFRLHRSLKKKLQTFKLSFECEIRIDTAFDEVINACANSPRNGQTGTWIVPAMVRAYQALHQAGFAHSIETWIGGKLVGGLYCVTLGKSVFGESMFTRMPNASKIALAALVCFCRHHGIQHIDCQQNTDHLASLGAREVDRSDFLVNIQRTQQLQPPQWHFDPLYWRELILAPSEPK
jgi:leucyl/phenylalanyl-tRNA---protein transferase